MRSITGHQDGYPAWYPLAFEIGNSLRALAGLDKGTDTAPLEITSKLRVIVVNKLLPSILSPVGAVGLPALAPNAGVHWSLGGAVMLAYGIWESLTAYDDPNYLK